MRLSAATLAILTTIITISTPTTRVVVTFHNASLNDETTAPENTEVVKKYGRRLVLRMLNGSSGEENWIQEALGGDVRVERVESDVLAFQDEDYNQTIMSNYAETNAVFDKNNTFAYQTANLTETNAVFDNNNTFAYQTANLTETNAVFDNNNTFAYQTANFTETFAMFNNNNTSTSYYNQTANYTETFAPFQSPLLPTDGWNLDETEPYALHIRSLRMLTSGRGVVVSVIDSGIADAAKAVLSPLTGYDFVSSADYANKATQARNPDYTDPGDQGPTCPTPSWHGTKVTSIVAAIAPGAGLTIMRVLGQCGVGFSSDIADAIVWAAGGQINGLGLNAYPATVISLSLAGKAPCPTYLQSAVNQAMSLGAVVIAAAGNAAQNVSGYFPANCKGVVAVGASTRQGTLASYSNWGEGLAFSAPGGDADNPIRVLSLNSTGALTPTFAIGTSFSAPHAAGFASLKLDSEAVLIPFSSCSGGICGRGILSHAAQSEPAQTPQVGNSITGWVGPGTAVASTACLGKMYDNVYSGVLMQVDVMRPWPLLPIKETQWVKKQAGRSYDTSADKNEFNYCPSPCYIDQFEVCSDHDYTQSGYVRYYRYRCSDGKWSDAYGSQSTCAHATVPATSPGGFTDVNAMGYDHIYGMSFKTVDGQSITLGNMDNVDAYLSCGDYSINPSTTIKRVMVGIQTSSNADNVNGFALYCGSFECGANEYMSATNHLCATCNWGGSNEYISGCGGTSMGTRTACATDCPANQFRSGCGGTSAGSCADCNGCGSGKKFSGCNAGSLSNNNVCTNCDVGTEGGSGFARTCTLCAAGTYNDNPGAWCTTCTTGKYNAAVGANSAAQCSNCAAGKYGASYGASSDSACTPCLAGYFSNTAGVRGSIGIYDFWIPTALPYNPCTPCPKGTYTDGNGKTICMQCIAGTYGETLHSEGAATCLLCATGTYSATVGASDAATCIACDAGKYNADRGGNVISSCRPCPKGTHTLTTGNSDCADCGTGTYNVDTGLSGECTACETGKYSADTGRSSAYTCQGCATGNYASVTGVSTCTPCVAGTFAASTGSALCSACSAGTYTDTAGGSGCKPCAEITSCDVGWGSFCISNYGSKCMQCQPIYACVYEGRQCFSATDAAKPSCLCNPGFEMSGGKCVGCAAGKYKSTRSSVATCTALTVRTCGKGTYLQLGTAFSDSICAQCPSLPPYARQGVSGCEWSCNAGFDNNAI